MHALICHPSTPSPLQIEISSNATCLANGKLQLHYVLQGNLEQIQLPQQCKPEQKDNLWQHTCFEAFIGCSGEMHYHEYNISPSGCWAIYAFKNYRQQKQYKPPHEPNIEITQDKHRLEINVSLPASTLPTSLSNQALQIGLSAVIESKNQQKTYWALNHPLDTPDFHHHRGFVLKAIKE